MDLIPTTSFDPRLFSSTCIVIGDFLFIWVLGEAKSYHIAEFSLKVLILPAQIPECWPPYYPVAVEF